MKIGIMNKGIKYPIGQQDFRTLREDGALYVDKTAYIERILRSGNSYFFLARPRRFGKSLFLSTLRYFFEGCRELFEGLYISTTEWDWESYPVLRLDLNAERYAETGLLDNVLDNIFRELETEYGVSNTGEDLPARLHNIIKGAHEKTGRRVIILVDEYDKPLVGNLNNDENFEHYRARLASIYSNFKSSSEHIRLVFLTGVSRFSKLSVFSDLNNLRDITLSNEYADVCGITEKELLEYFSKGIEEFSYENGISNEETCRRLKKSYDGYRFAIKGSDIYNPWSVLNAMNEASIRNYWNNTGKPTIVAESLRKMDVDLEDVLSTQCDVDTLSGFDLQTHDPIALMYQTGYITIKDYDQDTGLLKLGIPNDEVREGIFKELLPFYVNVKRGGAESTVRKIINCVMLGHPEELMRNIEVFFSGIPYDLKMDNENNVQNAFFILTSLIGIKAKAEDHTSDGSIDLTIETPKYVYIIEFKYDGSSKEALDQINRKQYTRKYLADNRRIFKIGASFSSKTRTIENPIIEEVNTKP